MRLRSRLYWTCGFVLILAALLFAVLYPAWQVRETRQHIEQLGGTTVEDHRSSLTGWRSTYWRATDMMLGVDGPIVSVNLIGVEVPDEDLIFLHRLTDLQELRISYSDHTDALFVPLVEALPHCDTFDFRCTRAGNATAEALLRHGKVSIVGLEQTLVSSAMATRLRTRLTEFWWSYNPSSTLHEQLKILRPQDVAKEGDPEAPDLFNLRLDLDTTERRLLDTLVSFEGKIEELRLLGHVTPLQAERLASVSGVRSLVAYGVQADSLDWLSGWTGVEHITLQYCRIAPEAWRFLAALPAHADLDLSQTSIQAEALARLPADSPIRSFEWEGDLRDDEVIAVCRLERLESLYLDGESLTDACIPAIAAVSSLTNLMLKGSPLTDHGIAPLAALKKLERLSLRYTKVGDDAVETLAQLPALAKLDLIGTDLTQKGYDRLITFPTLRVLAVGGDDNLLKDDGRALRKGLRVEWLPD